MLPVGSLAPDFSLSNQHRSAVSLVGFRGRKNVVVAFHPLAFTPVCSVQVQTYEGERTRLDAMDTHVLVISNDAGPSKKAWGDSLGGVTWDLLSDFHPHGEVAARYGVLRDDGLAERAVFLVDKSGVIRWAKRYEMAQQPDFQELANELGKL
jgi:peroxiredoxin (alkyl hydroperoxide reductase subunit C)